MIVRPRPGALAILFAWRGSILPQVAPQVIALTALSCLVVATEQGWAHAIPLNAGIGPFTLIGLALSIFLSFRNNACYDRWWEARKVWGALIVETRGLARLLGALLPADGAGNAALRQRCLNRLAGFAHALHARLRGCDAAAAAAPFLPEAERGRLAACASPADAALSNLAADLGAALREGALSDVSFGLFEQKLAGLSGVQAACERIQGTPLPFAYTLLLYRTAWLYCLLLPFGLAASLGWGTPVATALVAYTFFGLDALGDELEEPFGSAANDLPLDALLRTVDGVVQDALGAPVPPPLAPERYWLR
ncbi:putative membrane protein [Methylobacterium sp. 174MFSha1.1]|uniref:bestrophin family protein n=1 Tax=Methylobacterium sp. 174MFSha1.1 TaxID=1502749 RepID=UPI0008F1C732|nr:bestrophin family protein [Methylobacterium sp. 174MFSha1.1]SFV15139.1 putative membrane protein [Methylobacterium sp. 174MFSha1.1]